MMKSLLVTLLQIQAGWIHLKLVRNTVYINFLNVQNKLKVFFAVLS
jgi:hypothetical protein